MMTLVKARTSIDETCFTGPLKVERFEPVVVVDVLPSSSSLCLDTVWDETSLRSSSSFTLPWDSMAAFIILVGAMPMFSRSMSDVIVRVRFSCARCGTDEGDTFIFRIRSDVE